MSNLPRPQKQNELESRLEALGVREAELAEEFVRGSGAGGQKRNKTSNVVMLTHVPSGLQVRAAQGRSQALNRYYARKLLVEKLEAERLGAESERQKAIEKIRRQKRRRSRRAQEKVLDAKHRHSEKKSLRRSVDPG